MTQSAAKEETLEEIAERIATDEVLLSRRRKDLYFEILSALRSRDERAVRIIDDHLAQDVCNDNCWTTIKAAIRERTE